MSQSQDVCITPSPYSIAEAIAAVIAACKDGAKVLDLCNLGDSVINK